MTPQNYLLKNLLLPDLKLTQVKRISASTFLYLCQKKTSWEVCTKCPTKAYSIHDHRTVTIREQKIRNKHIRLIIKKRRFRCPKCKAVFTESIPGIHVRHRTTERYREQVLYDSKYYENMKSIAIQNRCSSTLVNKIINQRLELNLRKSRNTPWGKNVCIDEHAFVKLQKKQRKQMVVSFVDNNRKCLRELAPSKNHHDMQNAIKHIPGKEKVLNATIDMDDSFKNFVHDFFPNAHITIDKFHVLRLIFPAIRKYRKEITGDKRSNPIRHLLLKNRGRLKPYQKRAVTRFCRENPRVNEVYRFKERISNFYRIKGHKKAREVFIKITDDMAYSTLPEIKTLRKTLMKWSKEILQYFRTGQTNARVEGFNRKCKLIQRKAYGFRSFANYRPRVLYSCS